MPASRPRPGTVRPSPAPARPPRVAWPPALPLLVLLLAAALGAPRVVSSRVIAGSSMLPGLAPGDRVLVESWSYRQRAPRPGEVALLDGPGGEPLVKRVGGPLPRAGRLALRVAGDNPRASADSRHFGALPLERFRGRVVWRYWPPSRFGPVR